MQFLADLIVSGLAAGAVYGLFGMAYAAIYKATGVVNFAQGEVAMLIVYLTAAVFLRVPLPFWSALLIAPLIGIATGLVLDRLVIRPMVGRPAFAIVMVTIGLAVMLRALIVLVWGSELREFPARAGEAVLTFSGVGLYPVQILAFVVLAIAIAAAWALLRFSRMGLAMRATAIDERTATLMGIDVRRVAAIAWAASAGVSALAGVLFASTTFVGPDLFQAGLKAFPATIVGGLDSVIGSAIGGLILGVVENLTGGYGDTALKEISGFIAIVAVLMIRPTGLFGARDVERL